MITTRITINLRGLRKFAGKVKDNSPVMNKIVKQWAVRYRSFIQERFVKYSRGGGNWPPLKAATLKRRRGTTAAILRDTGTLFSALAPTFQSLPGQHEKRIKFGVEVGYGGPHAHPSGAATVADIASFHQQGSGPLPKREIIVAPPQAVIDKMAKDAANAIKKAANASSTN